MSYRWLTVPIAVAVVVLAGGCGGGSSGPRVIQPVQPVVSRTAVYPLQGRLLGDMDGDGLASVGDTIKILRIVVALDDDDPCADANQNGQTDVGDAIQVLRCVVGQETWPIGECTHLTTQGLVQLPAGFSLPVTTLTVSSIIQDSPVDATGQFNAHVSGTGPCLASLIDNAGRVVLLGYVDAAFGAAAGEISPQQTAVALMFQGLGGYTLPPAQWQQALELIAQTAEATQLASVIDARVAANPTAIWDGDQQIVTALAQACSEVRPAATGQALRALAGSPTQSVQPTQAATAAILVNPPSEQDGVLVNIGTGEIFLTNKYRRHVGYYVYRTAYKKDGTWHDIDPPQVVVDGQVLSATKGLNGMLGTLLDLSNGTVQYAPVDSDPMQMSVLPLTADATRYQVVIMGLANNTTAPPWWDSTWNGTYNRVMWQTLMQELVLPAVFSFLFPANQIDAKLQAAEFGLMVQDFMDLAIRDAPQAGQLLEQGQVGDAFKAFFAALASKQTFRNELIDLFVASGILEQAAKDQAGQVLDRLVRANAIMGAVDSVLAGADLGIVLTHVGLCQERARQWEVTAVKPNVRLQPETTELTFGQSVELLCTVGGITGDFTYHWSTTGAYGHLQDDRGHSGTEFDSTAQRATYVVDDVADNATETVTVKAYLVPEGGIGEHQYLGEAQSTITLRGPCDPNVVDFDYWRSGCSDVILSTTVAHPGETITITPTWGGGGGLCGGTIRVFCSHAVDATGTFTEGPYSYWPYIYSFSYWGGKQPHPNGGQAVTMTTDVKGAVTFTIDPNITSNQCISYDPSGNGHYYGPCVVVDGGNWSSVRMFVVTVP